MMNAWDAILAHVTQKLCDVSGFRVEPSDLVAPPDPKFGDLAFGCFALAQKQKKIPAEIARTLAENIAKMGQDNLIASVSTIGPYVNFVLAPGETVARIVQDIETQQTSFGSCDEGKRRLIMLEYAQPNTHKEFHVGHLRNLLLGNALARIFAYTGWKVITASYHGDVGAHVAKCLWMLEKQQTTEGRGQKIEKTGQYLGYLYAEATKLLDEHPELKDEVSEVQRKLEAGDKELTALWQETRQWSLAEFNRIFVDLDTHIDRHYFESELVQEGQSIVDELLKKKIAQKSQGAIVVDFEDEHLGAFLIRKSDGTSLYATKDLALAQLKLKEYPMLTRSLLLVDNRQTLYFKQLFRTLERMGATLSHEFVGYEFVNLKSGAMSSRAGNIVTYDAFRDQVIVFARGETQKRHPEWAEQKIERTAWCIAMGGIKYGMLKQHPDTPLTFDIERALSFDGDTGPYIQYAATRLAAILGKAPRNLQSESDDLKLLVEDAEKRLAIQIAQFPFAAHRASQELNPSAIAEWCFSLAQAITEFYHNVKVLEATSPSLRSARLRLVTSAHDVLSSGLELLGIPLPEEM